MLRKIEQKDLSEISHLYKLTAISTYKNILSKQELQDVTNVWFNLDNLASEAKKNYFVGIKNPAKKWVAAIQAEIIDNSTVHIIRLYVHPNYQDRGFGSKLLRNAIAHFLSGKKVSLELLKKNEKAKNFYTAQGFAVKKEKVDIVANVKIEKLVMIKEI